MLCVKLPATSQDRIIALTTTVQTDTIIIIFIQVWFNGSSITAKTLQFGRIIALFYFNRLGVVFNIDNIFPFFHQVPGHFWKYYLWNSITQLLLINGKTSLFYIILAEGVE